MEDQVKLEGKTARFFNRLSKKNYSEDDIAKAEGEAASKYRGRLGELWDRVCVLFQIAKHPSIWGPQVAVLATLAVIYLVSPLDAVPDAIPLAGLADDIAVIAAVIGALVKTASSFSQEKLSSIRESMPEKLRGTFDSMFSFAGKSAVLDGAFRAAQEAARKAVALALEKQLVRSIIRGIVSLAALLVAALFYGLSTSHWAFLIPSSIFLLASYGFLASSIIRFIMMLFNFYKGWKTKHSLEDGVVSVVTGQMDEGLKTKLVTAGIRLGARLPSEVKLSLLKFFRKEILIYLAQIVLVAISFFLLKHLVFMTVAGAGFFQSFFTPLYDLVALALD